MRNQMKFSLVIITLLMSAACSTETRQTQPVATKSTSGTSTAAPATDAEKRDKAFVRVINAVPGNKPMAIFADDQKVFDSVAFKNVTPYQEIPDSRHTFRLRLAGDDQAQPVAENTEGLTAGKHYSVVIMPGNGDKAMLQIVNDNITPPPAEQAQVRMINASPDAGEVDLVAKEGNKKLFSGINMQSETSYSNVVPMKTSLEVRAKGQDMAILTVPNANIEKGKLYTIVVTGHLKGSPQLQAVMVEDHLGQSGAVSETKAPILPENGKMVKTKVTK